MNDMEIRFYLNGFDLDVKKTNDGTWIDQKCSPDVVSYVSDCIMTYMTDMNSEECDLEFTIKDIMLNGYSKDNIALFGKPNVVLGSREYDKFFSQPIKLLNYANVIENTGKKGNAYVFKIKNVDLLEYISYGEMKAQIFLNAYVEKVLKDSGEWQIYESFFADQSEENFRVVKNAFVEFMCNNTSRGGSRGGDTTDIRRIFPKAFNILAVARHSKGTIKGGISSDIIQRQDILYNRRNFYDEWSGKPKSVLRNEHDVPTDGEDEARTNVEINKAKRKVKNYNRLYNNKKTETFLDIAISVNGICISCEREENDKIGTQVHHIFPKGQHPAIAAYLENLITLSPNQHVLYAHPEGNTTQIDRLYQYYLLLCKAKRIQMDESDFYSKEKFIEVLNTGFQTEEYTGLEENFSGIVNKIKDEYVDVLR